MAFRDHVSSAFRLSFFNSPSLAALRALSVRMSKIGMEKKKNRMEERAKPHRQLLFSRNAREIGGPIKVVMRLGALEKAKARVRSLRDDVSAMIMVNT
jgi:hypothetical protein